MRLDAAGPLRVRPRGREEGGVVCRDDRGKEISPGPSGFRVTSYAAGPRIGRTPGPRRGGVVCRDDCGKNILPRAVRSPCDVVCRGAEDWDAAGAEKGETAGDLSG